ncbi:2-keto-4-pentenoate hydratase [Sphingomonas montanisoli]|uniref:2-keto-4-pentenoate hydratase n=1 Tax=Sphingomonas montanisoli TaxID=2606412 RepID=A0A5D9C7C4_9SPHN|nr:2-keto-4-pentenoate hydratase [Sphingomonas montanisoli]
MKTPEELKSVAKSFVSARRSATGLAQYPGEMPESLAEAYAIQDEAIALVGEGIGGWKVGRIWPPMSERFGAGRLAGPIFVGQVIAPGADGLIFTAGFGAAEAEYLLRIGATPEAGKTSFTLEEAADLIDVVHIGIEIASSPFAEINEHGPAVTVSDFGNNNGLIVGPEVADWRSAGIDDVDITSRIDGEVINTARSSGFPDGVIGSARFLIENMVARGIVIEPGWWISTGAITGVHPVTVGQRFEADFGRFGTLACTIAAQPAAE